MGDEAIGAAGTGTGTIAAEGVTTGPKGMLGPAESPRVRAFGTFGVMSPAGGIFVGSVTTGGTKGVLPGPSKSGEIGSPGIGGAAMVAATV
jgi:hypothetical protein